MIKDIRLDTRYLEGHVSEEELSGIYPEVKAAHALLEEKNGPGSDFLGWIGLPEETSESMLSDIEECASKLRSISDIIIVVGIGGSYLGARSAIEMLTPQLEKKKVIFAGHNISGGYLAELEDVIKNAKDVAVNVVSKSGTTTEPAVAFRIIEACLKGKYGADDLKDRIVVTTDKEKGALKTLADTEGYRSFVIPDDVGGRFSVLTPVGLLPLACAGIDIRHLMEGARHGMESNATCDVESNASYRYAAVRNILSRKGKAIEILSNFDPQLHYFAEWWKQLFGESEGKDQRGIFPASCDFTTDLHSMGQWIQEGTRNIFETFMILQNDSQDCVIPENKENLDNLDYLAGRQVSFVNRKAYEATAEAHFEGGVPNMTVFIPEKTPYCLGQLFYFFEKAVAVSAYVSGVNPFNQPGVESYKKKMFKLLGKPA